MSKGRDFRGPRKRGFDDDMPSSPYESRPSRPASRPFGSGAPSGFGGGGGDMMAPPPAGPTVDAVVKWFKADKGFGFVELQNGQGDAFLHIGAIQSAGYETVPPGAKLKVMVGNGAKGAQVTRVVEVDTAGAQERAPQRSFDTPRPARRAPDPSTAIEVSGKVKWFDDTKGFGFVSSNDGGKDIFVHISILGPAGLSHLAEGQPVSMRVVDTPKGREALSISAD
ncbi:cold shock domain-containing protein [Lichenibacterium minor]|uniref:Cold shock domain-containing protein n=1 Tax=Lichenibacterium minor TaxID=2316528 RepID=A0A4Q2U5R5_9HYPH|nr:cold shock domain-containing protein [Lichenibacterium minor]RYC31762.1 cold shock domain-containing protein [Lichenibacterium minor]